jgi:dTDP-4-amino-4,6-dideoxygalactose transaminase
LIRIGDIQFGPDERAAIDRVTDRTWVSEGPEVRAFEDEFAAWVGSQFCVAVSSGTAALMVGLKASQQVMPIKWVLLPALTFIADANAVKLCGMEPVFTDVMPGTFVMDAKDVPFHDFDLAIPVHLFGYPCDMESITKRAAWLTHETMIAEDACEAHGTMLGALKAGTVGAWGAFSFYIAHTVQAGEMGCLVTNDPDLARLFRSLKAHGRTCDCRQCTRNTTGCPRLKRGESDPRFRANCAGYNFKACEFTAAIARAQLAKVGENLDRRRANVRQLNSLLSESTDLVQIPPFDENVGYMAYPLVLRQEWVRDKVVAALAKRGVESRPMFGCIPTQQPAYAEYRSKGEWPVADKLGADGFYVGCHQYLTSGDIEAMAETIKGVLWDVERGQL